MPDPDYGPSPVDLDKRWYQTMRPPLVNDPEIEVWRAVVTGHFGQQADSAWSVRWRTNSVQTAVGVHLDALALDLGFLRPDGWSDDRFQAVAIAIDGAVLSNRPPSVTQALATALVQPGQTFELEQTASLVYVVTFYAITDDEALTYCSVLDYGRPKGVLAVCQWSNVAKAATFVLDVSLLDGSDVLANP